MQLMSSDTKDTKMNGYCCENGEPTACEALENSMLDKDIASCNISPSKDLERAEEDTFVFDPPLYLQRYTEVSSILGDEKIISVADFGSAEGKIIPYLKRIDSVQQINAVDLDEATLSGATKFCSPLIAEYVNPSPIPLTVQLWQGDVTKFDSRFQNLDAITMVEVIEHLNPDVLAALPQNLFGHMQPRLVILTTPNAEFNVLFPNFSGFRHWDHKFEWTRAEFESWCTEQARTYDYDVSFSGVGSPPPSRADVGHCSQTALFRRKSDCTELANGCNASEEPYKLLHECVHPCQPARTLEEDILYEAGYYIRQRASDIVKEYDEWTDEEEEDEDKLGEKYIMEEDVVYVSIEALMSIKKISELCDLEKLRDVLLASDEYELTEDHCFIIHQLHSPEFTGLDDDNFDVTNNVDEDREVQCEATNMDNGDNVLEDWGDDMDNGDKVLEDRGDDMDNGDDVLEDWGNDTESDTTDKPWNDPANWNLSLEVTNPELIENLRKKGGDYMQGFHKGLILSKGTASQRFQCWTYDLEPGQTDDVESDGIEEQDSKEIVEKLSQINLGESKDTAIGSQLNCNGNEPSCDTTKDAAKDTKVDSSNTISSHDNTSQDFEFIPLAQLKHNIYTKSWYKPYYDTEEGQFDSE